MSQEAKERVGTSERGCACLQAHEYGAGKDCGTITEQQGDGVRKEVKLVGVQRNVRKMVFDERIEGMRKLNVAK